MSVQVGLPAMFGVTFDATGLRIGCRVFNDSGPVGAWALMANYDGFSYQAALTFGIAGAYSVKKVAFLPEDTDFTLRDPSRSEADDAVQAVDASAGGSAPNPVDVRVSGRIRDARIVGRIKSEDVE